jgi:hypothetical protein
MKTIALFLNLPWTLVGIVASILSLPRKVIVFNNPKALIFYVKGFWWYFWHPKRKYIRGMAIGNVVLLGPLEMKNDLEHELVHVKQFDKEPFIHPFLYEYQNWKFGYKNNKYEKEAYESTGSVYVEKK